GIEGEPGARAAAGRRRHVDLGDEAEAEQLIDPVGDGGTRETGRPAEIGTGAWPSVAKQLVPPAGVRQLGAPRNRRSHTFNKPHSTRTLAHRLLLIANTHSSETAFTTQRGQGRSCCRLPPSARTPRRKLQAGGPRSAGEIGGCRRRGAWSLG